MAGVPRIVVVDYHKGNLSSVARGLVRAGADAVVSDDPRVIRDADGIVLPGVGSFYDAAAFMRESGQAIAIEDAVNGGRGVPFLGICLGMQLLFERGDEGVPEDAKLEAAVDGRGSHLECGAAFESLGRRWVRGLGILKGSCTLLPSRRVKVPHVGWDQLHMTRAGLACPLLEGLSEGVNVYFTHSYALDDDAEAADVAARTFYARDFASVVWRGNTFGCQFHPEKSSKHGHEILCNFVRVAADRMEGSGLRDDELQDGDAKKGVGL